MPILVKDYTWTQTDKTVHIRIAQRDVSRDKVDLFTTDSYIKAHFNPFLFEVFLLHDVDNEKSMCIVKDDLITLDLRKRDETEWETLEKTLTRPEKMTLRKEIQDKCIEEAQKAKEERHIKKTQLDRFTVHQAMDIDSKQHELMDSRRDEQRKNAMSALEEWRVNAGKKHVHNPSRAIEYRDNSSGVQITVIDDNTRNLTEITDYISTRKGVKIVELPPDDELEKKVTNPVPKVVPKEQSKKAPIKPVKTPVKSEYVEKKKAEASKRILPKLRESGVLEVRHTPRTLPTPMRESKAEEEAAWLKNVTLARRATGFVSEDLRPEEQDPQWCKEKGDEFFRSGNFLGAVSAYTHGITLSDKLPSLYANRSATHFALGNFNKCLEDCSTALELLVPACEGNRRSRAKCMARRGAALARLGYLTKGIGEMKAAANLLPEDEAIHRDIYDMERAWEQNPDSD